MLLKDGVEINIDAAVEYKGVRYPPGWLRRASVLELGNLGIQDVPDRTRADDRFFWNGDTRSPREVGSVQAQMITDIRRTASNLLSPTDWMVIREMETGKSMPMAIMEYRELVRRLSNEFQAQIEALSHTPELSVLQFQWPVEPT